jgi:uncharacterized protein
MRQLLESAFRDAGQEACGPRVHDSPDSPGYTRRMTAASFTFRLLPESLAICRLPADAPLPTWPRGPFVCVTRTPDELSIVCDERCVPPDVQSVRGRRALGITGTVDFSTIGVIAGLTRPLADAGVSVFVVSTYDTDWILVQEKDLATATRVLTASGHGLEG